MASRPISVPGQRIYCAHCGQMVTRRTFYEHKRDYYDPASKTWTKRCRRESALTDPTTHESVSTNQVNPESVECSSEAMDDDVPPVVEAGDDERTIQPNVTECETGRAGNVSPTIDEDSENQGELWETDSSSSDGGDDRSMEEVVATADTSHTQTHKLKAVVVWFILLILNWQSAFTISSQGIAKLLVMIKKVLIVLAKATASPLVSLMASLFPGSLYMAYKGLGIKQNSFAVYAVCGRCYSIYDVKDCTDLDGGRSKRCTHLAFPEHRMSYHRVPCHGPLLKQVTYTNGKSKHLPIIAYAYKSLRESLERILMRPSMSKQLELWRKRSIPSDYYCDVYDGAVWKDNHSFFDKPRNYGLMLNLDWFQPFKHTTESIGAMYITIMNLPRTLRFKRENVILLCLIPHFDNEPPSVNSFLQPLVSELLQLNDGVKMYTSESPRYKVTIRARLLCAACDIPACRKLCGFLGHNAHKGCSKCFKTFKGGFGAHDYSGFDTDNWPQRDILSHRQHVEKIKKANSGQQKSKLESEMGVRYSALLDLPYFNCIRYSIVDPMHNLFLGTAKRMLKTWRAKGLILDKHLPIIQTRVNSVAVPPDVGRIPMKIASGFSSMSADQWKNWTIIYSLFSLRDILPQEHYRCWESFVIACRFLCSTVITKNSITKAHLLLIKFCKSVETLYGKNEITPNMHLHAHLRECVLDYGPIYSFWLFSFERYNGMLGDFPTNQRSIVLQLMKRFEIEQELSNITPPPDFAEDLQDTLHTYHSTKAHISILNSTQHNELLLHSPSLTQCDGTQKWPNDSIDLCEFPSHKVVGVVSDHTLLLSTYSSMYSNINFMSNTIPQSVSFYSSCKVAGMRLGIKDHQRTRKLSHVLFAPLSCSDPERELVPAQIIKVFTHRVTLSSGSQLSHCFAQVLPYIEHSEKFKYGKSLQIWSRSHGLMVIIPIIRVHARFAPAFGTIKTNSGTHESVMFICPLSCHLAL